MEEILKNNQNKVEFVESLDQKHGNEVNVESVEFMQKLESKIEEDKTPHINELIGWIKIANKRGAFDLSESKSILQAITNLSSENKIESINFLIKCAVVANRRSGVYELEESAKICECCEKIKN